MPTKPVLPSKNDNWIKYGGALLLLGVFAIFIAILVFSVISNSLMGKCVAVVNIDGEITTASSPQSLFSSFSPGSEDIARTVKALNSRDDVGAVLFVINSPGGGVVATREIYDAVKELDKPKVSYFREMAASGGYYVATATDYIVSEPLALTGSIGVRMTLNDLSGLLDKIGVNFTEIKSGEQKDMGSPYRPMTAEERQVLQTLVDEIFEDFKSAVVSGRGEKLDMAKFNKILDARVVSGKQAKEIGLVDELGNKGDAIMAAARLANITDENPRICQIQISSSASSGLFDTSALIQAIKGGTGGTKVSVKYE